MIFVPLNDGACLGLKEWKCYILSSIKEDKTGASREKRTRRRDKDRKDQAGMRQDSTSRTGHVLIFRHRPMGARCLSLRAVPLTPKRGLAQDLDAKMRLCLGPQLRYQPRGVLVRLYPSRCHRYLPVPKRPVEMKENVRIRLFSRSFRRQESPK